MARSLLRAAQLRDEDVMEEAEHDAWVHVNLVTSGTLNFQDGTISGTGDVYATTFYGDGSNLTGITVSGTNPESLYYNGTDVKATAVADGIEITNGTDTASILYGGEELQIYNTRNSGTIELRAKNSAGALTPLANFDPDGSTILRSEGNDILSVSSNSINIKNAANDSVDISPGAAASIASRYDGGTIQIEGDHVSDGSQAMMFLADPDGAVELYYDGSKVMETDANGIITAQITAAGSSTDYITLDDASNRINFYTSGNKMLELDNLVTILHADGTKGVEVASSYIDFFGATGTRRFQLYPHDTLTQFVNTANSSEMIFRSNNSSSASTDMLRLDPDGAAELYYSGVKAAETHSQGIIIHRDDASATLSMKFDASGNMIIDNDTGNNITLQANGKNLFGAWGNGVASVYYGGELRLATYSQGIILHRDDVHTRLVHSVGGDFIIQPDEPGGTIQLRGITTASGNDGKTLAIFDPDGAAELYHNGVKTIETYQDVGLDRGGIILWDATASGSYEISVNGDSNHVYFYNRNVSAGTSFGGLDSGEAWSLGFRFDPDGEAELFYDGVKTVETTSEGISVPGGGVKFPATQVPSSDVNTLDDYDEYTAANTACTGALTVSAIWKLVKVGNLVTLTLPAVNGTTTDVAAITFGVSVPTKYRPTASIAGAAHVWVNGAGLAGLGVVTITTGGVISVYRDGSQSLGWGTAANSGMLTGVSVSWVI